MMFAIEVELAGRPAWVCEVRREHSLLGEPYLDFTGRREEALEFTSSEEALGLLARCWRAWQVYDPRVVGG